jgi:hypothetical protein
VELDFFMSVVLFWSWPRMPSCLKCLTISGVEANKEMNCLRQW